jgi:hypothetical protein
MSRSPRLSYVLVPGLAAAGALLAAQACGGNQVPEDNLPALCFASQPIPDGGAMRPLRASEWASLVLRGYRSGGSASQDCVGNAITWRPTDRQCDVHEPDDEAAPRAVPVTDDSVIVGRSDSVAIKPVWVITHRFEDGDGFGPVMITERTADGVAVRATGTLRLPIERARLRLRETGGQRLIVADGERCPPEDGEEGDASADDAPPANAQGGEGEEPQPPTCLRTSRILPQVGDQLLNPEVRTPEGECLGPAAIHLSREYVVGIANGWERVFRLAASTEFTGGSVVIHEQVTAHDRDPRDPGRPPRLFRTTDADRVILLERGGMQSRGIPLFDRTIRAHGSTQLPIANGPERDRE